MTHSRTPHWVKDAPCVSWQHCARCSAKPFAPSPADPRLCVACAEAYQEAGRKRCVDCGAWRVWALRSPRCDVCRPLHNQARRRAERRRQYERSAEQERARKRAAYDPARAATRNAAYREQHRDTLRAKARADYQRTREQRLAYARAQDAARKAEQTPEALEAWRAKRRVQAKLRGGR